MYIEESTIDDLLRTVLETLNNHGQPTDPAKGAAREIAGILLCLTNPRARLSHTETRGRPFSCLGELCWYLAGSGSLEFMKYYISNYGDYAEGDPVFGAYGPRMFDWKGLDQIANIQQTLRTRPDSRRGIIQIFDSTDLGTSHQEVPCTCFLQFFVRSGKLHMLTSMRSNDIHSGFVHDVFSFTMLQEIIARSVGAELGWYKHSVGSLHLYESEASDAEEFLSEGWQSTVAMPEMPKGDPWPSIRILLKAEAEIRVSGTLRRVDLSDLDPYWADLIRLLLALAYAKGNNAAALTHVRGEITAAVYHQFVDGKLARLRRATKQGI